MASESGNAEMQLADSFSDSQIELGSETTSAKSQQLHPPLQVQVQRIKQTAEDKIVDVESCSVAKEHEEKQTDKDQDRNGVEQEEPGGDEEPNDVCNGLRLNERTILKLQEAFSLFDHDFDGRLSLHQTATMIRAVGLGLTEKHIAEILAEAPTAKIDFGTFLTSMADHLRAIKENRAEEEAAAIRDAFQLIEASAGEGVDAGAVAKEVEGGQQRQTGGMISRRRLTRLLTKVGEKLTKHEIDELLDDVGFGEALPDDEICCEALIEKIFEDY